MFKKMISMARSAEQVADAISPTMNAPKYDYGLCLRFGQETLDKLDLDTSDVSVGDMLNLSAIAEVTSVSKHDSGDGEKCSVELTLTHVGLQGDGAD